jgi:hypothetical protein
MRHSPLVSEGLRALLVICAFVGAGLALAAVLGCSDVQRTCRYYADAKLSEESIYY